MIKLQSALYILYLSSLEYDNWLKCRGRFLWPALYMMNRARLNEGKNNFS